MKHIFIVACVAVFAIGSVGLRAQDKSAKALTFTGCLETGSGAGTYMLTHVAQAESEKMGGQMASDRMKKMGGDDMAKVETLMLTGTAVDLSKHAGHKVSVTGAMSASETAKAGAGKMMGKMGSKMGKADPKVGSDTAAPAMKVDSLKMVATSCS